MPPPLAPVGLRCSVPLRIHFPASLRSTVVTRFSATTDALTPAGRFFGPLWAMNAALAPAGLPDYGRRDFRPFRLQPSAWRPGTARLSGDSAPRLSPALQASPFRAKARPPTPTESSSRRRPSRTVCVTDWSFSFRCSPPRLTATQLRFDTSRLFAARKRTLTVLSLLPLRRTRTGILPASTVRTV